MIRSLVVAVPADGVSVPLDRGLATLSGRPLDWARAVVLRGGAYLDQRRCLRPQTVAPPGSLLEAVWADPPEPDPAPLQADALLLRRRGLLAVDKPAGVHCQPARHTVQGTLPALVSQLLRLGRLPEPIHRLDRDTSGVVLLATRAGDSMGIGACFRRGGVRKGYLAWVAGDPPAAGVIDAHIGRARRRGRMRVVAGGGGRPARTAFARLAHVPGAALLWLRPETGRTHQLRVHCAHRGWPILGDPWYGEQPTPQRVAPRLCLHARWLQAPLPSGGGRQRYLTVQAPVPEDFEAVGRSLGWAGASLERLASEPPAVPAGD